MQLFWHHNGKTHLFRCLLTSRPLATEHDDVIEWKHFPRYWPSVRGVHRSPVTSPHKGQWRGALIFHSIYAWINGCVNSRAAGNLRRHRAHYDVIVMNTCTGLLGSWNCIWYNHYSDVIAAQLVFKKTSIWKHQGFALLDLLKGIATVTDEIPSKKVCNAERVSMPWRFHDGDLKCWNLTAYIPEY